MTKKGNHSAIMQIGLLLCLSQRQLISGKRTHKVRSTNTVLIRQLQLIDHSRDIRALRLSAAFHTSFFLSLFHTT